MFAFTVLPDKENAPNVPANVIKDVKNSGPVAKPLCFDDPTPPVTKAFKAKQLTWTDIQEKNFTEWINFAFAQADSENNALAQAEEIKEKMFSSFRKVAQEIDNDQITVRDERDIHVDVGLQDVLLELLQSYNMAWLRIGCNVVLEFKPVASPKQFQKQILQSMLWTDKKKVDGVALRRHFLKKMFEFVLFLDLAKKSHLVNVALFEKKSAIKSSKDILAVICKEFLKGEGDIFKHLALLNYKPDYKQTDIDEYSFEVKNIAVDLRDGVRLCRLVDLLGDVTEIGEDSSAASSSTLCSHLWVPAPNISRKEHNVKILLEALYGHLSEKERCVKPNDIVSGNRDKTFLLLWEIFFQVKLRDLLDCRTIENEIAAIESRDSSDNDDALNTSSSLAVRVPEVNSSDEDENDLTSGQIADKLSDLLKQWFKTMLAASLGADHVRTKAFISAMTYNTTPSTAMFEDGSALCYMINYYHPNLLKLDDILTAEKPNLGSSTAGANSNKDVTSRAAINRRRDHNWLIFSQVCSLITGIPSLSHECLSSKPLCENQPFLIFLAYLFSRLQMSKNEVRLTEMKSSAMEMAWEALTMDAAGYTPATASAMEIDVDSDVDDSSFGSKKRKSGSLATRPTASSKAAAEATRARKSLSELKPSKYTGGVGGAAKKTGVVSASAFLKGQQKNKRHSTGGGGLSAAKLAMSRARKSFSILPDDMNMDGVDDLCMDLEPVDEYGEGNEDDHESTMAAAPPKKARTNKSTGSIIRNSRRSSTGGDCFEPVIMLSKKQQEAEAARAQQAMDEIAQAEAEAHASLLAEQEAERIKTEQWLDAQRVEEEAMEEANKQAQALATEEEAQRQAELHAQAEAEAAALIAAQEQRQAELKATEDLRLAAIEAAEVERLAAIAAEEARIQECQEDLELSRMEEELSVEEQAARRAVEEAEEAERVQEALLRAREVAHQQQLAKEQAVKHQRSQATAAALEKARLVADGIQLMKDRAAKLTHHQAEMLRQQKEKEEEERKAKDEEERVLAEEEAAAAALAAVVKEQELLLAQFKSATIIQAFYRGHVTRLARKRNLSLIHAKLTKATKEAKSHPSRAIGTRTAEAISALRLYANETDPNKQKEREKQALLMSAGKSPKKVRKITTYELVEACKALEFSTQVSKTCCNELIRGESSNLLLHLIRTCDRSKDSQELLHHALNTLLNVARYDELAYFVSQGDNSSIATIVDLLQMFRDKKAVFSDACELMCRIVSADATAKAMCASPSETFKRIAAISQIIESKFKIESRLKAIADKKAAAAAAANGGRPENCLSPCKGTFLASKEPIDCIRMLMGLIV